MDAKGATLPHDAVEKQRRALRDLVVLDEELLELVDEGPAVTVAQGPAQGVASVAAQAVALWYGLLTPLVFFLPGTFLTMAQGIALPYAQVGAMAIVPRLSGTAAGIGATVPFVPPISAPGVSSFHAYCQLTTSMFEYACPFGRVQE